MAAKVVTPAWISRPGVVPRSASAKKSEGRSLVAVWIT
jgi:hypothetical protein